MVFLTTTCLMSQQGPNMFNTREETVSAFTNKTFSYYEPRYFDSYKVKPVNGKGRILAPLQQDAVVNMMTANGNKWVVLIKGVMLRWENNTPYAMDTCGNKIFSTFYPKEETEKVKNSSSSKEFEEIGKSVQRTTPVKTLNNTSKISETFSKVSDVVSVPDTSEKSHSHSASDNCVSTSGSRQFFATSGVVFHPYYYSNSYGNRYSYRYSYGRYRGRSVYRIRR